MNRLTRRQKWCRHTEWKSSDTANTLVQNLYVTGKLIRKKQTPKINVSSLLSAESMKSSQRFNILKILKYEMVLILYNIFTNITNTYSSMFCNSNFLTILPIEMLHCTNIYFARISQRNFRSCIFYSKHRQVCLPPFQHKIFRSICQMHNNSIRTFVSHRIKYPYCHNIQKGKIYFVHFDKQLLTSACWYCFWWKDVNFTF